MALFERSNPGGEKARKAVEDLRKRLKTDPLDVPSSIALADQLCQLGEKPEAVQHLSRTGLALHKKGKLLEAIALYKKVEQLDPKGEVTNSFLVAINLKNALEQVQAQKANDARIAPKTPAAPAPKSPTSAATSASGVSQAAVPGPSPEAKKRKEALQGAIASIPLLKDVPPFLIELIIDRIDLVTHEPGKTIFEEGAPGDSVIFIVSGDLSVTSRDEKGQIMPLRALKAGDVAGEISFLSGLPRTATLRAATRCVVLELPRKAFEPILKRHRRLHDTLTAFYKERVLDLVLARSPLFAGLPQSERDRVAPLFMPVLAKAGDLIIKQGEPDSSLYVIRRGEVRVTTYRSNREVALAILRPHDFFGDVAPTRGTSRTATVTAVTPVELLVLSKTHLDDLLARNPQIRSALEEIQLQRFVNTSQILARP